MLSDAKQALRNALRQRLRTSLEDWFFYWLCAQNAEDRRSTSPRNCYYEFGVGWARTLTAFARAAVRADKARVVPLSDVRIVAFDSFEGLPKKASRADDHPDWDAGTFAHDEAFVYGKLAKTRFPRENVRLVKGFFEDSLTPALATELGHGPPPSIVTIDVDYYSSTAQALAFLRPLLRSGAVFYFDDLYSFHLHPDMGQVKAIREFDGTQGYLSPLREYDFLGRTFMYSALAWEHHADSPARP